MSTFSRPAQIYIWSLAAIAVWCLVYSLNYFPLTVQALRDFTLFCILSIVAGLFPVKSDRRFLDFTVSVAVHLAAVYLFPFGLVVWISTVSTFVTELSQRRVWYKAMFNVSQVSVTYTLLYVLLRLWYDGHGELAYGWYDTLAFLMVSVGYYLVNSILVVLVISLTTGVSWWYILRKNFEIGRWHHIGMSCGGFLIAILWSIHPWSIVLVLLPILVLRQSLQLTVMLEQQTFEAIEALVDTIDARDGSTHLHSERVAQYARGIAEELQLSRATVESIAISARLHDIGKLGIGDTWLLKPGPLTEEERTQFELHPVYGADIIAKFSVLSVEYGMIRNHHERWDGNGYPDGLQGEEIPLGARVIAVADAFDAMTSDRPYRKALSVTEARRRLREGAGTQWDPEIISAALRVLPQDSERQAATSQRDLPSTYENEGTNSADPVPTPINYIDRTA